MVSYFFCIYILSVKVIIIIFLKVVCGIVMNIIKKWSIDFLDINAPLLIISFIKYKFTTLPSHHYAHRHCRNYYLLG